jgi:Uma2 family endonuclease
MDCMGIADAPAVLQRHRLSVEDYHRMGEAGVFAPNARMELIEGEVIDMAPMKSRHASAVARLLAALQRAVGDRALVWCQLPLSLGPQSEPEPDLMLLRPRADFYAQAHPVPADVLLLIEVADSSIEYDRGVKVPLYAQHGVAEVWIADLDGKAVRFFRQSDGERYRDITATETPGPTPVAALPGVSIDLSGVLS